MHEGASQREKLFHAAGKASRGGVTFAFQIGLLQQRSKPFF